jgi:NAD(P)-dependent dehydrogenase (short-subunit alcohol dehydrogenase family)
VDELAEEELWMRTALITGGAGAIGSATARLMLEDGYAVALAGRSLDRLEAARRDLPDADRVVCIDFDAADWDAAHAGVRRAAEALGELDAVVNCAGVFLDPAPVDQLAPEVLAATMAGNFATVANVTVASVPFLRARRGCLVNVAATDAWAATPGFAAEGASKAAVVAFSQHAAADLGAAGIRVNVVAPGWVQTPMSAQALADAGLLDQPLAVPLLGAIGTADDVAQVIRFLASPGARYMTGATVVVDGGQLARMADARRFDDGATPPAG